MVCQGTGIVGSRDQAISFPGRIRFYIITYSLRANASQESGKSDRMRTYEMHVEMTGLESVHKRNLRGADQASPLSLPTLN